MLTRRDMLKTSVAAATGLGPISGLLASEFSLPKSESPLAVEETSPMVYGLHIAPGQKAIQEVPGLRLCFRAGRDFPINVNVFYNNYTTFFIIVDKKCFFFEVDMKNCWFRQVRYLDVGLVRDTNSLDSEWHVGTTNILYGIYISRETKELS